MSYLYELSASLLRLVILFYVSEDNHDNLTKRAKTFPAYFKLISAITPCPCGWLNDPQKAYGYAPAVVAVSKVDLQSLAGSDGHSHRTRNRYGAGMACYVATKPNQDWLSSISREQGIEFLVDSNRPMHVIC